MGKKLIIKIIKDEIHYGNGYSIPIRLTTLPNEIINYSKAEPLYWETEIVYYNKSDQSVELYVINKNLKEYSEFEKQKPGTQLNFIKFSSDYKYLNGNYHSRNKNSNWDDSEKLLIESGEINFNKIEFLDREVKLYIPKRVFTSFTNSLEYRIPLSSSIKEFEAIKSYIKKNLGDKLRLEARIFQTNKTKKSRIEKITTSYFEKFDEIFINNLKLKFTLQILNSSKIKTNNKLHSSLEFLQKKNETILYNYSITAFFKDMQRNEESIHKYELQYLERLHSQTDKISLQFINDSEFSFLFFIESNERFSFVLETYKKDFATYIWTQNKSHHNGDLGEFQVTVVNEIAILCSVGREKYRNENKGNPIFTFIEHSSDSTNGFDEWKRSLENKLGLTPTN